MSVCVCAQQAEEEKMKNKKLRKQVVSAMVDELQKGLNQHFKDQVKQGKWKEYIKA